MKHKFLIPVLALLFALPEAFGCWVETSYRWYSSFDNSTMPSGTGTPGSFAGLLLNADSQISKWKILYDNAERSTIYISISDILLDVFRSGTDPETGEDIHAGGTSQLTTWNNLYVYSVTGVDGDTVTIGGLIRTIPLPVGPRVVGNVSEDGWLSRTFYEENISPVTGAELVAGYDRVLCSLSEIDGSTATLELEQIQVEYDATGGAGGPGSRPLVIEMNGVTRILIEKIDTSAATTVTTMDFSDCSLSMPGTELPFTPRAVIGSVEVTKTKYNNASTRYRLRSAVQDQIMVVSNSSGGSVAETQTYTAPVTAAALVVTDSELQSDTFHAPAVTVSADSQPIWGRYSIDPVGLVVGDELTCRLVLTADGIDSDSADGELLIITPPANATQSITVTGVNRPER